MTRKTHALRTRRLNEVCANMSYPAGASSASPRFAESNEAAVEEEDEMIKALGVDVASAERRATATNRGVIR